MLMRLFRCRDGVGAVEFALMLPILVALMVAIADFGLAVNEKMRLTSAARAGAQVAYKASGDLSGVVAAVQMASGLNADNISVTSQKTCACLDGSAVACTGTCSDGNSVRAYVTVSVSEQWSPVIVSTVMSGPVTMTGTAVLRVK